MAATISPLWRFVVTDLNGATLTILDHLASDRSVTPKLNEPLEVSGMVPSDSSEVNILHTDGFPFVAEGVRQLYCFRRESDTSPYYTIRASTLILQVSDASGTGDARSQFTAWDPWQYLFSVPVLAADGKPLPKEGSEYSSAFSADAIIVDLLENASLWSSITAPAASQDSFIDWSPTSGGTIETCSGWTSGYKIQQGTSIGQAILDIVTTGYCDVVLNPIYDPVNRPGILCSLSIFNQNPPYYGVGSYNYAAVFAWDRPGRSVVSVDNIYDGSQRANTIQYFNGQGGPPVTKLTDAASVVTYGDYWSQQFFPAQTFDVAVRTIAAEQLVLRKSFKETLTIHPAPERSPEPFVDYYLGDRVPVYVSNNMRQVIPPVPTTNANINLVNSASIVVHSTAGFPVTGTIVLLGGNVTYTGTTATAFTGCSGHPATAGGELIISYGIIAWQRIYGIPVDIDDNGVETVRELLVGPVGPAPPVGGNGTIFPPVNVFTTNQRNARNTKRIGAVSTSQKTVITV